MLRNTVLTIGLSLLSLFAQAQDYGTLRGFVYEKETGEPVMFANVILEGTTFGASTNIDGFFTIAKVPTGTYTALGLYIGYDTASVEVSIQKDKITTEKFYLGESSVQLTTVEVSAERQEMKTEVRTSVTKVTAKEITTMPAVGGEPDLAQYLQVLPGVIFTGDQGGQLYIRGGAPVHNLTLLDGMVIYNPFHSIGFFSVFDTDIIRNADVYTGGMPAEYGGRISSTMDVSIRDGNKNRLAGKIGASTFATKLMLEGPLRNNEKGSTTFLVSAKRSYLEESSQIFYDYASEDGLPFGFTDLYAKLSSSNSSGSKFNVFGFNFRDRVNYAGVQEMNWNSYGAGSNFVLVPAASPFLMQGDFSFSNYAIELDEGDGLPRTSEVGGFNLGLDFTYFLPNDRNLEYGLDIQGFNTDFIFFNSLGRKIEQRQSTTELAGYLKYKWNTARWVWDLGFRMHYYASLSSASPEPRIGVKFNATEKLRFKASGGLYSQNLIAANSDRDVVNLFYGFLSGSDNIPDEFRGEPVNNPLQKGRHVIFGFEYDLTDRIDVNVEGYIKDFNQMTNINRNKIYEDNLSNNDKPEYLVKDFIIETGLARGIDVSMKYADKNMYVWFVYSLGKVTRTDEFITYAPHFDRRHNINIVTTYKFGKDDAWEINGRWNFGSGFPFTQTAGFYELLNFEDGINTDPSNTNGELGIVYDDLNGGRLPTYHRLDLGMKRTWKWGQHNVLEAILSITNVYDRQNIFYFDRVDYERVDQLPILPSVGFTYSF
ncbi:TonB-dependent receptor [Cryomorphaceae bacterium]|nr:TonB-dependent receptor [Cryomorphaceae bacterium]